ncbi:DUF6508 domain-containing protein [Kitasatospora sp. NPDC059327]|uniref:DUF6508 domain-containing protein n=1 Tax=Kitasatospora sp. NPDC059327 TaxID=3346803 RepID=UPI0036D1D30F
MPELTSDSAREIISLYHRTMREPDASPPPLGMTPAEQFAVEASPRGLTESGFDWKNWEPYQDNRISDPAFIASADTATLRRIATTHLRLDRFVGGHLEKIEETGILATIVDRLQDLVDSGDL